MEVGVSVGLDLTFPVLQMSDQTWELEEIFFFLAQPRHASHPTPTIQMIELPKHVGAAAAGANGIGDIVGAYPDVTVGLTVEYLLLLLFCGQLPRCKLEAVKILLW